MLGAITTGVVKVTWTAASTPSFAGVYLTFTYGAAGGATWFLPDGGLTLPGTIASDGGFVALSGCYTTPAGCTVCDDGIDLVLNPLDGLCYAPPCAGRAFPELLAHVPTLPVASPALRVSDPSHTPMPDGCRVKPPSCDACRFDPVCPGIAPGNALLFGFDELVPCP